MARQAAASVGPAGLRESWHALSPYVYPVRLSLLRWLAYGLFFFGLTRCLNSRKRIKTAVVAILLLRSFESLYGIMETYSGHAHIWWFRKIQYIKDVTGTYVNRNHFAGAMEMGIILAVAYAAALGGRQTGRNLPAPRRSLKKWILGIFSSDSTALRPFLTIFAGGVMESALFFQLPGAGSSQRRGPCF